MRFMEKQNMIVMIVIKSIIGAPSRGQRFTLAYETHLGIVKSNVRVREFGYWPGMVIKYNKQLENVKH